MLRADEVNMAVDTTGRDNIALATDDLGARADDDVHAWLHIRITGFANGDNAPAFQTDVGLHNTPMIQDERIGHHAIDRAF